MHWLKTMLVFNDVKAYINSRHLLWTSQIAFIFFPIKSNHWHLGLQSKIFIFFGKSYMRIISYKTKYDNNQNNDWYFIILQIKKVT